MLLNLLMLYNATFVALNEYRYTDEIADLFTRVEKAVLNNQCIEQCCPNQLNCSKREFVHGCTEVINALSHEEIVQCGQMYLTTNWPYVTLDKFHALDEIPQCYNKTMSEWNELAFVSKVYKNPTLSLNALEACFYPQKVPIEFQKHQIKLAEQWKKKALKQRQVYLKEDIRKELLKYNFGGDTEITGSGFLFS